MVGFVGGVKLLATVLLFVSGLTLGLLSWLLLGYGSMRAFSPLSRWNGLLLGSILIAEVIAVWWSVGVRRRAPWLQLARAVGTAGWVCARLNWVFLNAFGGTL